MTREEATLKLTLHLHALGMLMPEDWLKENGEGSELQEAFRIALDVLKGEEIDQIKSLTLEELKTMDGEPVWIEFIDPKEPCPPHWRIWNTHEYQPCELGALGEHWLAYLEYPIGVDEESGLPHLWHLACNAAFLIALEWRDHYVQKAS